MEELKGLQKLIMEEVDNHIEELNGMNSDIGTVLYAEKLGALKAYNDVVSTINLILEDERRNKL